MSRRRRGSGYRKWTDERFAADAPTEYDDLDLALAWAAGYNAAVANALYVAQQGREEKAERERLS